MGEGRGEDRSFAAWHRRNYDVLASVSTAAAFVVLDAPWPLWLVWSGLVVFQIGNRIRNR